MKLGQQQQKPQSSGAGTAVAVGLSALGVLGVGLAAAFGSGRKSRPPAFRGARPKPCGRPCGR